MAALAFDERGGGGSRRGRRDAADGAVGARKGVKGDAEAPRPIGATGGGGLELVRVHRLVDVKSRLISSKKKK